MTLLLLLSPWGEDVACEARGGRGGFEADQLIYLPLALPAMRLAQAPLESIARKIAAASPLPKGRASCTCAESIPSLSPARAPRLYFARLFPMRDA